MGVYRIGMGFDFHSVPQLCAYLYFDRDCLEWSSDMQEHRVQKEPDQDTQRGATVLYASRHKWKTVMDLQTLVNISPKT
jgi:hypothetical protein